MPPMITSKEVMGALEMLKAFTSNTPFAYDSVMRTAAYRTFSSRKEHSLSSRTSKTFSSLDEWMDEEW